MIITAVAHNIKHALAEARRVAKIPLEGNREVMRSGGEEGLYRVHLESGVIVECTLAQHVQSKAWVVEL